MRKTTHIFILPYFWKINTASRLLVFVVIAISSFLSINANAQNNSSSNVDAAYLQTITQRSQKIVAGLGIIDSLKFYRVQAILVDQYRILNTTHDGFNAKSKMLKSDTTIEKKLKADQLTAIEADRLSATASLHKSFLEKLSKELSEDQIILIKDGVTYNILPVTYKAYQEMLPKLTAEQKAKIYEYLTEARELAMDAESSEKKHAWFGKYKGRINNYLSAAGIDMKKEEAEWQKRIKEKNVSNNKA